eukprot:SAG11_NODE_12522_length_699_cov_0.776667_1_plen_178_part_10
MTCTVQFSDLKLNFSVNFLDPWAPLLPSYLLVARASLPKHMVRTLGTRLHGIDLRLEGADEVLAAAQFERVRDALHQHGVVVIANQSQTRQQLHNFAKRWAPIALHLGQGPNEFPGLPGMLTINDGFSDENPPPEPGATQFGPTWHADFAACVHPGYATVLCCQTTPVGPTPQERCDT